MSSQYESRVASILVGLYSIVIGSWFLIEQTIRLFLVEKTEAEFATLAIGRFDWGFIWADTFLPGPMLFIGGLLLISSWKSRTGHMFVFTGFAINLYAMIVFLVELSMLGEPISAGDFAAALVATALGVVCMAYNLRSMIRSQA